MVIGGKAGDFLGEYMTGSVTLVLGLTGEEQRDEQSMKFVGVGMHGARFMFVVKSNVNVWGKRLGLRRLMNMISA